MTRFALDANVIMNATFVPRSWSRMVVQKAAAHGCKLVIGAATLVEAENRLREHARAIGKSFDPTEGTTQVIQRFSIEVFSGGTYPDAPAAIPKADKHVYSEAVAANGILVTNDRALWIACGGSASSPLEVLRGWFTEEVGMYFFGEMPTAAAGSLFFRGTPQWGGVTGMSSRHFAFDADGAIRAYYDAAKREWVAELPGLRPLRVAREIGIRDEQVVCVSWEAGRLARLFVGGVEKSDDVPLAEPLKVADIKRLSLGGTAQGDGAWGGHIWYGVMNDRPVSRDLWKQINAWRALAPNPYDDDRLQSWMKRLLPH